MNIYLHKGFPYQALCRALVPDDLTRTDLARLDVVNGRIMYHDFTNDEWEVIDDQVVHKRFQFVYDGLWYLSDDVKCKFLERIDHPEVPELDLSDTKPQETFVYRGQAYRPLERKLLEEDLKRTDLATWDQGTIVDLYSGAFRIVDGELFCADHPWTYENGYYNSRTRFLELIPQKLKAEHMETTSKRVKK